MGYGKSWYGKAEKKSGDAGRWEWKSTESQPYEPAYKRTCSNCGGRGHDAKNCSSKAMCSICGIPGHSKENCRNATKRCEICGAKGHLKNVCTYYKDPEQKASKETWWREVDSSVGCMRCGAEKFHPKHTCPSFGHKCELCGRLHHLENMCGEHKAKLKKEEERTPKKDWKSKTSDDWKSKTSDDWKSKTSDWKSTTTSSWKGQKTKSTAAGKATEKPWKIAMQTNSKAKKVVKTAKQRQECHCCGSWQHQKSKCPFANQRCDKCGKKGHLKQKCQQDQVPAEQQGPEVEAAEAAEAEGTDPLELPEEEEEFLDEAQEEVVEGLEGEAAVDVCSCCGAVDHDEELCPLIDMTCELCGMQGHLDSMCVSHEVPSTEKPGLCKGQQPQSPEMKPRMQGEDPPEVQTSGQEKPGLCKGQQPQSPEMKPRTQGEDPPEVQTSGQGSECYCCGERGHLKQSCPLRFNVCKICGIEGHMDHKCRSRQMECYGCGEYGHQKVNCPFKHIPCSYCGKLGHLRSVCRDAPKEDMKKKAPWHR